MTLWQTAIFKQNGWGVNSIISKISLALEAAKAMKQLLYKTVLPKASGICSMLALHSANRWSLPVEVRALEAKAFLVCAESSKILSSLWHLISCKEVALIRILHFFTLCSNRQTLTACARYSTRSFDITLQQACYHIVGQETDWLLAPCKGVISKKMLNPTDHCLSFRWRAN